MTTRLNTHLGAAITTVESGGRMPNGLVLIVDTEPFSSEHNIHSELFLNEADIYTLLMNLHGTLINIHGKKRDESKGTD